MPNLFAGALAIWSNALSLCTSGSLEYSFVGLRTRSLTPSTGRLFPRRRLILPLIMRERKTTFRRKIKVDLFLLEETF